MSSSGHFVAQILETRAAGYAGLTASLLLERHPEIAGRYEPDGFARWKDQLQQWLLELSAAVGAGEPSLFEARMLWTKKAFVSRQAPLEDLQAALAALREILHERLPEGQAETALATVDRAIEAVARPRAGETGGPDPGSKRAGRSALSYLETILEGNPREAVERLLEAVDGGASVKDIYLQVLIPAQHEVGRMWHAGDLSIAEEHIVTMATQRAMALLCDRARPSSRNEKTAVLACVAGNVHDLGIRAISDFFEMAGWRAINLGPDVPQDEIVKSVQFFDADVVVLAAALHTNLKGVQRMIERIRALEDQGVKVIVGGSAFEGAPDLWRKVGADGYAEKIEEVEPLGSRLLQ